MIARILLILAMAFGLVGFPTVAPANAMHAENEEQEWAEFHALATQEYADEFTAFFDSYETKWSKNGRLMMRAGDSGSFKFVKKS